MRRAIRYFFPKRHDRTRIPLLPRRYVDPAKEQADPGSAEELLMIAAVARTPDDARKVISRYEGMSLGQVIRAAKRARRHMNPFVRAWKRLVEIW